MHGYQRIRQPHPFARRRPHQDSAEIAIAIFKNAFERWVEEANQLELPDLVCQALAEVRALSAEPKPAPV